MLLLYLLVAAQAFRSPTALPAVPTRSFAATAGLDEASVDGKSFAGAVYKFVRPHTIRGTMLGALCGVTKAITDTGAVFDWQLVPRAMVGVVALLSANALIVGINQIYDQDIDRVNKPFLPIAAGELSTRTAWALLGACGLAGPILCYAAFSPFIFKLYVLGTTLGVLYSVPPFDLKKRGPLVAGATIAVCRGFLLNFGVYYAALEALGQPFRWSPAVAFISRFMTVFAAVIAVTKDLPDVEGDAKFKVQTFATRLGPNLVVKAATAVLLLNYASAVAQAALFSSSFRRPALMLGAHLALAAALLNNFRLYAKLKATDLTSALKRFYKKIWDLFYLEYALYVFI
ncbi:hypothetical protein CTAYLR_007204 [Chrysophaeum taylorii]|uniref:Uncharacterized protein n=1 Tax=Chrysophaeum taylorii TaxID=2483200 RepID=A0AAD7UMD4_9STRA|nr:hypothetical protein CTAYLR_007204 [Chrysophaeum taylorii]